MPDVFNLSCPVCENRLSVPVSVNRFACMECGSPLLLHTEGGIAFLSKAPVATQQPVSRDLAHSSSPGAESETYRERVAALRIQVEQVSRELEQLHTQPPDNTGAKGKMVGKILLLGAIGCVVLAVVLAMGVDNAVWWQGVAGVSVVLGTLGIIFYGDGQRTLLAARQKQHAQISDLESLRESGLQEIARLEQENDPKRS